MKSRVLRSATPDRRARWDGPRRRRAITGTHTKGIRRPDASAGDRRPVAVRAGMGGPVAGQSFPQRQTDIATRVGSVRHGAALAAIPVRRSQGPAGTYRAALCRDGATALAIPDETVFLPLAAALGIRDGCAMPAERRCRPTRDARTEQLSKLPGHGPRERGAMSRGPGRRSGHSRGTRGPGWAGHRRPPVTNQPAGTRSAGRAGAESGPVGGGRHRNGGSGKGRMKRPPASS